MMLEPEEYYENYLKGKTSDQIMTQIRSLKRKINRLQNVMDHPDYPYRTDVIDPDEGVQVYMYREYIKRAKTALEEAGVVYTMTKAEQREAAIEASMPYASKVIFSKGCYLTGGIAKIFTIGENTLFASTQTFLHIEEPDLLDISEYREEFLEELADLHLERWRRHYDLYRYGMAVMDGESWKLEIQFSNGHRPLKITGENAYPFAFYYLEDVLGLPFEQKDDEREEIDECTEQYSVI